jgi:hypothetical protein
MNTDRPPSRHLFGTLRYDAGVRAAPRRHLRRGIRWPGLPARLPGGLIRCLAAIVVALGGGTDAAAATYRVDSATDVPVAGQITLREAIAAAGDGDTIEFAASLFSGSSPTTIRLSSALVISINLTLAGPGDAPGTTAPWLQLEGSGSDRILQIRSPAGVVISGIAFRRGVAAGGGALLVESGATAVIVGCDFTDNQATGPNAGGAILNRGTLTLDGCLLARNSAKDGGGLASLGPTQVVRSLIEANFASDYGGGVYGAGGDLVIESSTISGNTGGTGGGIAFTSSGKVIDTASLTAVTVAYNVAASQSGGLYVEGAGAVANVGGSTFAHNLLVNRTGAQTQRDLATQKSGKINSAGYNIIIKPGETFSPSAPNDQIGVDPQLGALAYNGGRTRTHAIGSGSPARDRGNPAFTGHMVPTDQRGSVRAWPAGGRPDVGAFEFAATLTCAGRLVVEATGATMAVSVPATLTLPRGGTATVTWIVAGQPEAPSTVTIPETTGTLELSYEGAFPLGATAVSVNATAAGLSLSCSTTVEVVDTTAPRITLLGANPYYIEQGEAYTDPGATAVDLIDGAIAVSVDATGVNTSALGIYSVVYRAVDAAGNVGSASRVVVVRDTTPPVLSLSPAAVALTATDPAVCSYLASSPVALGLTLSAVDSSDPSPSFVFELLAGGVYSAIAFPHAFAVGTTTLYVSARDASGNVSARQSTTVVVRDGAPPIVALAGGNPLTVSLGAAFTDPGINTSDACSPPVTVTRSVTVAGVPQSDVDPCAPGTYVVTYTATDAAGNGASVNRTVTVTANIMLSAATPIARNVDPTLRTAPVDLAQVVSVSGVPAACSSRVSYGVTIIPPTGAPVELAGADGSPLPTYPFAVGTSAVDVKARLRNAAGVPTVYATASFAVVVADPYGVALNNVVWPFARDFTPYLSPSGGRLAGTIQQMIARAGESRWYTFRGTPGSRIEVTLTRLPANFDIVVYSDIGQIYNELLALTGTGSTDGQRILALLGAEFAPEAYSPEAYSPEAYSPEAYSPEAYSPEAYSPEAYSPEAYSPEAYSPEAYSPEAYSPEAYSPEAYSPEAYSPEAYSPEAYASAQQRGVVAFSASPGTASEGIRFNTYSRSGEYYIRVRGQNGVYSTAAPFDLTVAIQQDLCSGVIDLNTTPATTTAAVSGTPSSLLVWDRGRMPGTETEKSALATALASFAAAVNGVVVNVGADVRINALNAQADANPFCPIAKNLVAEAIRHLIRTYRAAAPTLADITLIGSDHVIPFFRSDDRALLASEASYFPPVRDGTQSQSSLRYAQLLSQDRYGSSARLVLATGPYDLPEIAVGRLVETAAEVRDYLDTYAALFNGTATAGTVPTPRSAFVAGYDFLADSAEAMSAEFAAGLGPVATVRSLISAADLPPAFGWTANQLRAAFLGSRHDLSYLAGHFSTAGALAADYATRFRARELDESAVNLAYALILSPGCHSGYNTVDGDAILNVTEQPDWAQAFARKRALWVAGTGYQYGDTDFVEYTERLLLELARALRTGAGPVTLGGAMVAAKRRYLADTPIMRGIHEKTLLVLTLYGLPMVKFDLPGTRLAPPAPVSDVAAVAAVTGGPGAAHGLGRAEFSFNPLLTRVDKTLHVVGGTGTVVASYFTGSDGVVSIPGEPVRPRESFNVSRPEGLVRGVGFRGARYVDLAGFRPFTGAPATETRGVHGRFSTEVFYPVRPWNLNQTSEHWGTGGMSKFTAFPTQFVSDGPDAVLGTLRRYEQMQFTLYYCPATSSAALANAPALNVIASSVGATAITFSVEAAATAGAGVQEVWITYTGLPGSPHYGAWQSLTLTAPANATGIGTWTGTLPLGGASAEQIRFMVQAVNGFGAVTQNTNFGRCYQPGTSTLDGVGMTSTPTAVALLAPVPATGTYRSSVSLQARLAGPSGEGISGRRIHFRIGPVVESGLTDLTGVASATLSLGATPGAYSIEVSFAGDATYQNSSDARPFTITKAPTTLTFESGAFVVDSAHLVVSLRASDRTPLKERTVVFILDNGTTRTAVAEITDGAGQARLTNTTSAPGTYLVTVHFGQPVTLPDGSTATLGDPLYAGCSASKSVTVSAPLHFGATQAWVQYDDPTAPGASLTNGGVSKAEVAGTMAGNDSSFGPNSILASPRARNVGAYLFMRLSGKTLARGMIELKVQANNSLQWRGSTVLGGARIEINVSWNVSGGSGKYHVWVYPPAGSGPLYNAVPALLTYELILGTGDGEKPAGGAVEIGGPEFPWTQQTGNSRVRSN